MALAALKVVFDEYLDSISRRDGDDCAQQPGEADADQRRYENSQRRQLVDPRLDVWLEGMIFYEVVDYKVNNHPQPESRRINQADQYHDSCRNRVAE
jgi:hypothetical protein